MRDVHVAIADYLAARNRFLAVAAEYPDLLAGNDNIIGRIGEYLAIAHLSGKGRASKKAVSKSQKGHDLLVGSIQVSVKVLTSENKKGRGLRLTDPWDELLVLDFNTHSFEYRVGHLSRAQFNAALAENPGWSKNPIVKKTMLGIKGLIGRYGAVESGKLIVEEKK